jgi:hypothetical protein
MRGVSSISAPLLAAAAVAALGVIVQQPNSTRFPTLTLVCLSTAAAALITSVNAGNFSTYYDGDPIGGSGVTSFATPSLSATDYTDAVAAYRAYTFWFNLTRQSYTVGIYALWTGVALALVPAHPDAWRFVALAPIIAAAVADLLIWRRLAPEAPVEPVHWVT